jgi:flagellar biosynthetic protein FlhB
MSDETDRDSRTEEPSEKKLKDASDKGNDPLSREAPLFASLIATLAVTAFLVKPATISLATLFQNSLDHLGGARLNTSDDAVRTIGVLLLPASLTVMPIILLFAAFGLVAHFAQSLPRFIGSRIAPELQRISPVSGLSRLFGAKGLMHFLRTFLQLTVIGAALWMVLRSEQNHIALLLHVPASAIPQELLSLILSLVAGVAAASAVLVAFDIVWTRFQWRRDLRMTKQEVKEEARQAEGDPMVKARLRSIALDRARRRMMAQVPRASLVIANPTHYAIAIRYVREEGGVPIVVAKGQDLIALKIREIAAQSGVPVIEQKLLARSMYDLVDVDQAIPQQFYRAVAELIHVLSRKKSGLLPAR